MVMVRTATTACTTSSEDGGTGKAYRCPAPSPPMVHTTSSTMPEVSIRLPGRALTARRAHLGVDLRARRAPVRRDRACGGYNRAMVAPSPPSPGPAVSVPFTSG